MSGDDGCPGAPYTETTFRVTYEFYRQRWLAQAWQVTVLEDGTVQRYGTATREFGPFDSFTDVQHWLAREASMLKYATLTPEERVRKPETNK